MGKNFRVQHLQRVECAKVQKKKDVSERPISRVNFNFSSCYCTRESENNIYVKVGQRNLRKKHEHKLRTNVGLWLHLVARSRNGVLTHCQVW